MSSIFFTLIVTLIKGLKDFHDCGSARSFP